MTMDINETREYLKRQISNSPGASMDQRERFCILELVYGLHGKINRLERNGLKRTASVSVEYDKVHNDRVITFQVREDDGIDTPPQTLQIEVLAKQTLGIADNNDKAVESLVGMLQSIAGMFNNPGIIAEDIAETMPPKPGEG